MSEQKKSEVPMYYRKKSGTVYAVQWFPGIILDGLEEVSKIWPLASHDGSTWEAYAMVASAEGKQVMVKPGDWVIKEPDRQGYRVVKEKDFGAEYEPESGMKTSVEERLRAENKKLLEALKEIAYHDTDDDTCGHTSITSCRQFMREIARETLEVAMTDELPKKFCRGCHRLLLPENLTMADGCACNSPIGVNHGLVPKETCTCFICDPTISGCSRYGKNPNGRSVAGTEDEQLQVIHNSLTEATANWTQDMEGWQPLYITDVRYLLEKVAELRRRKAELLSILRLARNDLEDVPGREAPPSLVAIQSAIEREEGQ